MDVGAVGISARRRRFAAQLSREPVYVTVCLISFVVSGKPSCRLNIELLRCRMLSVYNSYAGNRNRRSLKHNQDSSGTKSRRHRLTDCADPLVADDARLAKNLLRAAASDDEDDVTAATGRHGPPASRDVVQPSGFPCSPPTTSIAGSVLAAVSAADCPFCWAQLTPVVDDCANCRLDVGGQSSSHRCRSTPVIRITPTECAAATVRPRSACIQAGGGGGPPCHQHDADLSINKRRSSSLTTHVNTASSPSASRGSVPDIARTFLDGPRPPTPPPPPALQPGDRWLSAGVASLHRPTSLFRTGHALPTCLR